MTSSQGSGKEEKSLDRRPPTFVQGSQFQRLNAQSAFAGVMVNNIEVRMDNNEALVAHLDTLTPDQEVATFRNIQGQIQAGTEIFEDIAYTVWEVARTRRVLQNRMAANLGAFNQEFAVLHDSAERSKVRRERIAESLLRLTTRHNWMTEAFLHVVALNQTNGQTAVLDALNEARNAGAPPIQLFARASGYRLQRLAKAGPYVRYATSDLTITPQDIRNAINAPRTDTPFLRAAEARAAQTYNLIADTNGIHWIGGFTPPHIEEAYRNNGRILLTGAPAQLTLRNLSRLDQDSSKGTQNGSQKSSKKGSVRESERAPSSPVRSLRGNGEVDYTGMQITGKGKAKGKRPADGSPELGTSESRRPTQPVDITDLISSLRTLHVDPSRPPLDHTKVKLIQNPLRNANDLEKVLWTHVVRKAQAIYEQANLPEPTKSQRDDFGRVIRSLPDLHHSLQRLTNTVREAPNIEQNTLRGYLEGIADGGAFGFAAYDFEQYTIAALRTIARQFRSTWRGGHARIGDGRENNQGVMVTPEDFETLIRDENHSGWLNDVVLMAALLGIARGNYHDQDTFVIPANIMLLFRTGQITIDGVNLPATARNLVIPFHWGNHWTVGLVDVATHTIQHLDSRSNVSRHRQATQAIENLLRDNQEVYGSNRWNIGTLRSGQQANDDDCGLWVIENARNLMEGENAEPAVGPSTRRYIAQELYTNLLLDTPPSTARTQRELDIARANQLAQNTTGSGRNAGSPLIIPSTPGPDMPHLPNFQGLSGSRDSSLSPAPSNMTNPFETGHGRGRGGVGPPGGNTRGRGETEPPRGNTRGRGGTGPPRGNTRGRGGTEPPRGNTRGRRGTGPPRGNTRGRGGTGPPRGNTRGSGERGGRGGTGVTGDGPRRSSRLK